MLRSYDKIELIHDYQIEKNLNNINLYLRENKIDSLEAMFGKLKHLILKQKL